MSRLVSDFRHSLRLLAAAPGLSTVAVLILGLGIGAGSPLTERSHGALPRDCFCQVARDGFDNGERRFSVLPSLAVDLEPGTILSFATEIYRQRGRNCRHAIPATAAAQRGDFSDYPLGVEHRLS